MILGDAGPEIKQKTTPEAGAAVAFMPGKLEYPAFDIK